MSQATNNPEDFPPQSFEWLLATASQLEAAGNLEKAITTLQSALPMAFSLENPTQQVRLLNALSLLQKRAGYFAQARETLLQAISQLEGLSDDAELAVALWSNLAFVEREAGNLKKAREYQGKAFEVAQANGNVLERVEALLERAILDKDQQRLLEAKTTIEYALQLLGKYKAPRLRGHIYTVRALLALLGNQLEEARPNYAKALAAYRRAGDRENQALVLHNLGQMYDHHVHSARGYKLALSYYSKSLQINRDIGAKVGEADDFGSIAGLFQLFGELELAQKMHQAALEAYRSAGFRQGELDALTDLGILARDEQRFDDAHTYLSEALQIALAMGNLREIVSVYFHRGDLFMVMHHFEEAAADYARAAETTESIRALLQEAESLNYFDDDRLMAYEYLIRLAFFIQQDSSLAFFYMERLKSRAFLQRLRLSPLWNTTALPTALVDQETRLLLLLRQLTAAMDSSAANDGPASLAKLSGRRNSPTYSVDGNRAA